jgi:hypothetical protein
MKQANSSATATVEPGPIEIWDRTNPRSVLNLVTPVIADSILQASRAKPELFLMDEQTLRKVLSCNDITPTDSRLRMKFWNEYERAQSDGNSMGVAYIISGVCTKPYFYDRYLRSPVKVAWMMCPPANYIVMAEEALSFGLSRMRDILEMDDTDAKGKPNVKLLELKVKITAMLDARVKGSVIQQSVQVQYDAGHIKQAIGLETMEELDKRIKQLEGADRRSAQQIAANSRPIVRAPGEIIDVEAQ